MRKASLQYFVHVSVWIILYFVPYLLKGRIDFYTLLSEPGAVTHLISFIFLIGYSYLNYFLLIPRFYFDKKYVTYVLCLIVCLFVVIKVPQFFEPHRHAMRDHAGPPREPPPVLFGMNYNIILFLASTFLSLSLQYRARLFSIEREKLNAELSFLKAQINPHFLFNTLNSIYSLAIEKSDAAPDAIIQLSDLMRYQMQDAAAEYVELNKELKYIDNYIALQRRRLGNTVRISYASVWPREHLNIAPLLLVSFIENAFKHGVNPDQDSEINIAISITGKVLRLTVANNKVSAVPRLENAGIGLKNTKARLAHLYPQRHELFIRDESGFFSVDLKIMLA